MFQVVVEIGKLCFVRRYQFGSMGRNIFIVRSNYIARNVEQNLSFSLAFVHVAVLYSIAVRTLVEGLIGSVLVSVPTADPTAPFPSVFDRSPGIPSPRYPLSTPPFPSCFSSIQPPKQSYSS